jgi:uncharacterized cupin superfamily protein
MGTTKSPRFGCRDKCLCHSRPRRRRYQAAGPPPNIQVVSQPDNGFLETKGVFAWETWDCEVSQFPWNYTQTESCYLLAGQVTVTPADGRPPATFGKGDFVTFPAGMPCMWDVTEAVQKHFVLS